MKPKVETCLFTWLRETKPITIRLIEGVMWHTDRLWGTSGTQVSVMYVILHSTFTVVHTLLTTSMTVDWARKESEALFGQAYIGLQGDYQHSVMSSSSSI